MKKLVMAMTVVLMVGCANNPNASDYELCQAMSGDTFTSGSEAAQIMQSRFQAGTSTLSPADCASIAQSTAAGWQQKAANLNAASAAYNQQLQAAQPKQTVCNPNLGGGFTCNQY